MEKLTLIQKLFELKQKSIVLLRDEAAYNYKYADLAQIQDKLSEALAELRILIVHSTQGGAVVTTIYDVDSDACISSAIEIGKINTTREWDNNDKAGNVIHNIEITEQDPQAVGSIITYYRRYNLLQLLDLKTEDNDGASASPRAKNNATSNATTGSGTNTLEFIKSENIDALLKNITE
jgi:hypothetical protein